MMIGAAEKVLVCHRDAARYRDQHRTISVYLQHMTQVLQTMRCVAAQRTDWQLVQLQVWSGWGMGPALADQLICLCQLP